MRTTQNDNADEGGFNKLLANVLNHLEPIDALLEHPVFTAHLWRFCWTYARNKEDAEDLFNESSLKLTLKIDQFDPSLAKATFVGWLRTMVRRIYIDRIRLKSLKIDETPADERHDLIDPGADPFEETWLRELRRKVNELVAKREKTERLILTYYLQGLSFRAVENALKTGHGIYRSHVTIRTVVHKLLKEFQDSQLFVPAVDRKANTLSKRPVAKAKLNRKAEKVSKRRVSTRRHALKK